MTEKTPKRITITDIDGFSELRFSIYPDTILVEIKTQLEDCITGYPIVEVKKQDLINLIEQCK